MYRVLYFVSSPAMGAVAATESALEAARDRLASRPSSSSPSLSPSPDHPSPEPIQLQFETSVPRLLAKLRGHAFDALVIDSRGELRSHDEGAAMGLLRTLFHDDEVGGPIAREQTWVVVGPDDRGVAIGFEAGRSRVAGTLAAKDDAPGWEEIWKRIEETTARKRAGKVALCLAGGGIEGLLYELGALRALSYFLPDMSIGDVDILCGISAGAILSGFLANGLTPYEIARGMQLGEGKLDKIHKHELFDPNFTALAGRSMRIAWDAIRGKHSILSAAFRIAPSGVFSGDNLLRYLERQLGKPGMTDRFDRLRQELLIGATDLDTGEHVVFGSPEHMNVPISAAARASSALTPFYSPMRIDGRDYVDGGFTRTTNMRAAVQAGATLVILIDPLVPLYSEQPGYVASKGAVFTAMQGLKTLIHARFDKAARTLREMYPHVSFHLFQPDGQLMKAMSGSPMKYFYRASIEELAFRDTLREIRMRRFDALTRDFRRHGIRFVDPDAQLAKVA